MPAWGEKHGRGSHQGSAELLRETSLAASSQQSSCSLKDISKGCARPPAVPRQDELHPSTSPEPEHVSTQLSWAAGPTALHQGVSQAD